MVKVPFVGKRSKDLAAAGVTPSASDRASTSVKPSKEMVETQIDDFLRKLGIADPIAQTDERGWRHFANGSAQGRAGVMGENGDFYLFVQAPVMPLPADKDLILPLMRELLEENLDLVGSARLGITQETVFAAVVRSVNDLHAGDVEACVVSVMSIADDLDDKLMGKYGGTSRTRVSSQTVPKTRRSPALSPRKHPRKESK